MEEIRSSSLLVRGLRQLEAESSLRGRAETESFLLLARIFSLSKIYIMMSCSGDTLRLSHGRVLS
jgi:hypothetical protein